MDIPVNADVYCRNGDLCGRLTHVVLKPDTDELTHLVVHEKLLPRLERLVPIESVVDTSGRLVRLACSAHELKELPPFFTTDFHPVEPAFGATLPHLVPDADPGLSCVEIKRENVPQGEVAVREGAQVVATDGRIGKVDAFFVDPESECATHLVLREGHLWGYADVIIPASEIDRIEGGVIYLKLDKEEIEQLPAVSVHEKAV